MSLHPTEIERVVEELKPLAEARLRGVSVHKERALSLELVGAQGPATLLVCAEPELARLHVVRDRPAAPREPSAFQVVLRSELLGSRLVSIEVVPGDRVVALRFSTPGGREALFAELSPRNGNLLLVGEDGLVRALAFRASQGERDIGPGKPYEPPLARPVTPARERFSADAADAPFPLSFAIEREYRALEERRVLDAARRRLREPVRTAMARASRALEKLKDEAARVPKAEADRRLADLLKPNLHLVRRGDRHVTVTEYTPKGPREVAIVLDPALSPRENMERHYRHYRRIVESAARVASREAEVRTRLEELRRLSLLIDESGLPELSRLEREARTLGAGPRALPRGRPKPGAPVLPYRTFRSGNGTLILVGKGAAQNDTLTRTVARGNDLWLHARGIPGAHVVVRMARSVAPDQDTLLDAAQLALYFSDARGTPQGDVTWTRAKYVKKPKGAAPGAVTYHQEKVLAFKNQPNRIERLLAGEEDDGS